MFVWCVDILYSYMTVLRVHFIPACQILSDKPRLIRRTQLKRSAYTVVGGDDQSADTDGQQVPKSLGQTLHDTFLILHLSAYSCVRLQGEHHIIMSSPRAFPIIWGRRNGYAYHSSTLSCPVRCPPLTLHFPYLFYTSVST